MIEIMRTNDLVLISFVEATLAGAGMRFFVADGFTSAMEGSLGFLPRRILVEEGRADQARRLLAAAFAVLALPALQRASVERAQQRHPQRPVEAHRDL